MKVEEAVKKEAIDIGEAIKKMLAKQPMSEYELADHFNLPPKKIIATVRGLEQAGLNFSRIGSRILLHNYVPEGGRLVLKSEDRGDGWIYFGIITDNHKGNRHHRQDVENAAYETFAREGVKHVLNAGNWIDGVAKFNLHELVAHGMDEQLDLWIQTTPSKKGITTHFISGDDHEGWYNQRESMNIGLIAELTAKDAGREDLHFIGHVESDVELKARKGSAVLRIMHPGGGSAYAFSYVPQKIVESFQGGEKPQVLILGHFHKWDVCFPREVHVISAGCCEDQTMFMRKKKIAAHVGYVLVGIQQDQEGHITRVRTEWLSFYDRKFYEHRFG